MEHLMIDVYIYRPGETLVYHMQTTTELAALVAAFQSMHGWTRIEAVMPDKTSRIMASRPGHG